MELQSRQELVGSMWRSICADLENRRAAIHAEITAYPTPIPACDADFNYLLEERAKILHEMDIASSAARTREDSGQAAVAIEQFIARSKHISEKTRHNLERELTVCRSRAKQ